MQISYLKICYKSLTVWLNSKNDHSTASDTVLGIDPKLLKPPTLHPRSTAEGKGFPQTA